MPVTDKCPEAWVGVYTSAFGFVFANAGMYVTKT